MALLPFLQELWLETAIVLSVWILLPVWLVSRGKIGSATMVVLAVSAIWILLSIGLYDWSKNPHSPKREGQTWVSLFWLAATIGALSSTASATMLLLIYRRDAKLKKAN